jgi:alpha-beta hydrolase superfamily lysophospholipase
LREDLGMRTLAPLPLILVLLMLGACAPPIMEVRMQQLPPMVDGVWRGESTLAGARATTLYQQWWRPATQPRGVVAIVHGFKDHGDRYDELARRLVKEGVAVYALDLRGHGRSAGRRAWFDAFDDNLTDVDVFLADVRRHEPGLPVFLFGHSIGGAVVTLYTITHQPPLAGLIVHAGALKVDIGKGKLGGVKFVAALFPGAKVFPLDLHLFSHDPIVVDAALSDPFVWQPDHPARTAREALGGIARVEADGAAIKVPLLLLHGTADRVTPPAGSQLLASHASSSDKQLRLYPGLYHDLIHEPERDTVLSDIVGWVSVHLSRGAR